jgi:hypothetical protein
VFMAQSLTEAARVFVRSNAAVHVVEKFPLHRAVYALQVFFNPWVVFNCPSQGCCAIR